MMLLVKMKLLLALSVVAAASCTSVPDAYVEFVAGVDNIYGTLNLQRLYQGVLITGQIYGLTPGQHGFHVHEKGDLSDMCTAAGGHFNPFNSVHGAPFDSARHVGDLGNVEADYNGVANIYIQDNVISLDPNSPAYIGGLAIVVHQGVDDLGRGNNPESLKTGNAGKRSGCGIIQVPQGYY